MRKTGKMLCLGLAVSLLYCGTLCQLSCRRGSASQPSVRDIPIRYYIAGLAVSPDGERVAVLSGVHVEAPRSPSVLQVFDVKTGREIWAKKDVGHDGGVAFSPDGRTLAVAVGSVTLFDAASGKQVRTLDANRVSGHEIQFLPDGRSLVCSARWGKEPGLTVYDLTTGEARRVTGGPYRSYFLEHGRFALSREGGLLAYCCTDGDVQLWDTAAWVNKGAVRSILGQPVGVQLSPDGSLLFVRWYNPDTCDVEKTYFFQVIDLTTGKSKYVFPACVHYGVFTRDNRFLITDTDIREASTGEVVGHVENKLGGMEGVALSADQSVLALGGGVRGAMGRDPQSAVKVIDATRLFAGLAGATLPTTDAAASGPGQPTTGAP